MTGRASTSRVVLRGGRVYAPDHPAATAMAVDGADVTWLGDDSGSDRYADAATDVVDLEGALVTPAFVDAHVHLAQTGLAARGVDLRGAGSRTAALDRVAAHAAASTDPVILGHGWDESDWSPAEAPGIAEVDRAVGGRPAYLARVDVHSAVVSSGLLARAPRIAALAGWSARGRVERDAHHAARAAADSLVPPAMRREAIETALHRASSAGLGAVHELGAPHLSKLEDFALLDQLAASQPLPEVVRYWGELGAYDVAVAYACRGLAGDLCADGSIGSRTAALDAPYTDAPQSRGHLYLDAEQVGAHVVGCTRRGLQAGFHVIGDRAVATVLAGFRAAAAELGTGPVIAARHRLEHLEMMVLEGVGLLSELGVSASVQPAFDAVWGGPDGLYARRLGERWAPMNPFGALARQGIALAFGSDSPVTPMDPWAAVRAAVRHRNGAQRMPVPVAFDAHTRGGWRAGGRDGAGVLRSGAPATYAVWEVPGGLRDGLPLLGDGVALPRCQRTVVGGRTVYDAGYSTREDRSPAGR